MFVTDIVSAVLFFVHTEICTINLNVHLKIGVDLGIYFCTSILPFMDFTEVAKTHFHLRYCCCSKCYSTHIARFKSKTIVSAFTKCSPQIRCIKFGT